MPLRTYATKADFDESYSIGAEPEGHPNTRAEVRLNYHRAVFLPYARQRAQGIVAALGWTTGMRIVIVGCGFGWIVEALEGMGFTSAVGIDTSAYIHGVKDTTEEADINTAIQAVGLDPAAGDGSIIKGRLVAKGGGLAPRSRASRGVLNENMGNNQSRGRIRQALGLSGNQEPDVILTESVLESLTDAECVQLSGFGAQLSPNIYHFVVTLGEGNLSGFNWKTLEEWKALLPADQFVEAGTFRVL